jgi:DNA polymerase elongation subunit (family B)
MTDIIPSCLKHLVRPHGQVLQFEGDIKIGINSTNYDLVNKQSGDVKPKDSTILVIGSTKDGMVVAVKVLDFHPYFYVKINDMEQLRQTANYVESKYSDTLEEVIKSKIDYALKTDTNLRGLHVHSVEFDQCTPVPGLYFEPVLVLKITLYRPKHITMLRDKIAHGNFLGDKNVELFECNVNFLQRFHIDMDLPGMGWITIPKGLYRIIPPLDRTTYVSLEITCSAKDLIVDKNELSMPPAVYWSLDSEQCAKGAFPNADNRDHKTIIWGILIIKCDSNGITKIDTRLVFCVGNADPIPGAITICCENEESLHVLFTRCTRLIDPDGYIGYNSVSHDLAYEVQRNRTLALTRLASTIGNVNGLCRQRVECRVEEVKLESGAIGKLKYRFVAMDRLQADLLVSVRRDAMMKLDSFTLNSVCGYVLNLYKHDVHHSMIPVLHEGSDHDRKVLNDYCLYDAELPYRLDVSKMYMRLTRSISNFTYSPYMMVMLRGQQPVLQSLFLSYFRTAPQKYIMKWHEPPKDTGDKRKKKPEYDGAVVLAPRRLGYFRLKYEGGIVTLDFASHYPYIIVGYNLCYTTFVPPDQVESVRARGIPVRQAPSPQEDYEERLRIGKKAIAGHHFIYPWRNCSSDEAEAHKSAGRRVRQILDNSYIKEEVAGTWQWEDPDLIGILPRVVMNVLGGRAKENKLKAEAQDRIKIINHVLGIPDAMSRIRGGLIMILGPKQVKTIDEKAPKDVDSYWSFAYKYLAEALLKSSEVKRRMELGETPEQMIQIYYNKVTSELWEDAKNAFDARDLEALRGMIDLWEGRVGAHNSGQNALKVIANSIYGFTGATTGKLPMIEISSTVTAYGRDMILFSRDCAEMQAADGTYAGVGCPYLPETLYGDTDSVMVLLWKCHDIREIMKLGKAMAAYISVRFQHPNIKLAYEKAFYDAIFFQKKRYCAIMVTEDGTESLMFKGIEAKRKDNPAGLRPFLIKSANILLMGDIEASIIVIFRLIQMINMDELPLEMYAESRSSGKTIDDYAVPNSFVRYTARLEQRRPGSVDKAGRCWFVKVVYNRPKNSKDVKDLSLALEDPEYVLENPDKCILDRPSYLEKIKDIVGRLYADVILNNSEARIKYSSYDETKKRYKERSAHAGKQIFEGVHVRHRRDVGVFDKIHKQGVNLEPSDFYEFHPIDPSVFVSTCSVEFQQTPEFYISLRFFRANQRWPNGLLDFQYPSPFTPNTCRHHWRFVKLAETGNFEACIEGLDPNSRFLNDLRKYNEWIENFIKYESWSESAVWLSHPSAEMRCTREFIRLRETVHNRIDGKVIFGPIAPSYITVPLNPFDMGKISLSQSKINT